MSRRIHRAEINTNARFTAIALRDMRATTWHDVEILAARSDRSLYGYLRHLLRWALERRLEVPDYPADHRNPRVQTIEWCRGQDPHLNAYIGDRPRTRVLRNLVSWAVEQRLVFKQDGTPVWGGGPTQ